MHLHDQCNVVHADIKPDNVLLVKVDNNGDSLAKLTDFGLAFVDVDNPSYRNDGTVLDVDEERRCRRTQNEAGELRGSRAFLAPEIVDMSVTEFSRQSDIYALGLTTWCVLAWCAQPNASKAVTNSGNQPWQKVNDVVKVANEAAVEADAVGSLDDVDKLLKRCLDVRADDRWDAQVVRDVLSSLTRVCKATKI